MFNNIKVLMCDIGGVLSVDPWETIFATDPILKDFFYYQSSTAKTIGRKLFNIVGYTYKNLDKKTYWTEEDYWEKFINEIKVNFRYCPKNFTIDYFLSISSNLKYATENFHSVMTLLIHLKLIDIKPIIFSNNTEFWFQKQVKQLKLDKLFDLEEAILSHRIAKNKIEILKNPELLEKYILKPYNCSPQQCLYFDDHSSKIKIARKIGIEAIQIV